MSLPGNRKRQLIPVIAGVVVVASVLASPAVRGGALAIEGQARVLDNATLEIWGHRIRLTGITVPDPGSVAGQRGKSYLETLVNAVTVRCEVFGRYGTTAPGRCFAGNADIAALLIRMGHARERVQQSAGE